MGGPRLGRRRKTLVGTVCGPRHVKWVIVCVVLSKVTVGPNNYSKSVGDLIRRIGSQEFSVPRVSPLTDHQREWWYCG